MAALVATVPLVIILIGMGILRRSAIVAGSVGLLIAVLLTATFFTAQFGSTSGTLTSLMVGVGAEALHSTGTILWIILPALAIYEYQKATGAIARIRDLLASLTTNRRIQAILIAWFFGLFMEGAAGFGTPVALAAPLLVGLGYSPVRALVLALLGHAAGVSFGAVGTPVLAQASISGLDAGDIALATAALHALCGPVLLLIMVRLAASGPLSQQDIMWTMTAALCFLLPSVGLAALIGPELPTLGGALVGAVMFIFLMPRGASRHIDINSLATDLAPYGLILTLVLMTRLIEPVQMTLTGVSLDWRLTNTFSGSFQPFYHPGTLLLLGLILGAVLTMRTGFLSGALGAALRRLAPVAGALLVMLALSRLMVHSGMIEALAGGATSLGPFWPVLAPIIGVLGTFITGSATASNILFTDFQISTARGLDHTPEIMVGAQGFGAAMGNVIAPHNIIAGSATVGLSGREGEVMARTILPCAACALMGGLVVLLASFWH